MCTRYTGGICSNIFNQINVTMVSNRDDVAPNVIESVLDNLVGNGTEITRECKKRISASLCVVAYLPCRAGSARSVCRKDCMDAMRLIRECVPYPASKRIVNIFNCERFTNITSNCFSVNQRPIEGKNETMMKYQHYINSTSNIGNIF